LSITSRQQLHRLSSANFLPGMQAIEPAQNFDSPGYYLSPVRLWRQFFSIHADFKVDGCTN